MVEAQLIPQLLQLICQRADTGTQLHSCQFCTSKPDNIQQQALGVVTRLLVHHGDTDYRVLDQVSQLQTLSVKSQQSVSNPASQQ